MAIEKKDYISWGLAIVLTIFGIVFGPKYVKLEQQMEDVSKTVQDIKKSQYYVQTPQTIQYKIDHIEAVSGSTVTLNFGRKD